MKHQTAQSSLPDFNVYRKRQLAFVIVSILALCASALSGAWLYARFYAPSNGLPAHNLFAASQASHDTAYLRETLAMLADKVGALQAQLIAVNALGHRVAEAAGVEHTEPELRANLPFRSSSEAEMHNAVPFHRAAVPSVVFVRPLPDVRPVSNLNTTAVDVPITTDALERRLDDLFSQASAQEDGLALLDLMLTRRAGAYASLPSVSPVDFPYQSSSFGWRRNPVTGRHAMHEGLDFAAPAGTPIYAASGGVVTQARFRAGYGNLVEIMHGNGLSTRYAHASEIKVAEGDLVDAGQIIALVGSTGRSTGAHLHFEVRVAGRPIDPALFLPPQADERLIADAGAHLPAIASKVR